jgi:DeoR/GlpR family transcriptional regulator of sugar metabolism
MYNARHEQILTSLSVEREVTVADLSNRLKVSEVTIRKDLTTLENLGCLIRTRGGAVIAEDFRLVRTIAVRQREHIQEKQAIARAALQFIRQEDTVFLDAGSTCLAIASLIRNMNLHVITNSLDILAELSSAPNITLTASGGSFRKSSGAFVGPHAVSTLRQTQFNVSFIGTTGFSEDGICSSQNTLESEMKRQALAGSRRKIVVADSSKFGVRAFSIFAYPKDYDMLITDSRLEDLRELQAAGVEVLTADLRQGQKNSE